MHDSKTILLVDDDHHLVTSLAQWLRELDMVVTTAGDLATAKQRLNSDDFDLVITDLRLGPDDGFKLIAHVRQHHSATAVLVMSGYATPGTAVEAVRAGAFDLLTKPVIDDELLLAIDRAVNQHTIEQQNESLRRQLDARSGLENILSHDYRMMKIFDVIDNVANAKASILINGENGTGKSMIARAIHSRSSRRGEAFVEVACGALPDNLLESELFGHVAGAYTGANTDRVGKFELADRGTLFLDEIATATPAMQVKLLRVLQELQFEPLGGTSTKTVDTRVILATNEDLTQAVETGRFRQDLFYRINVINIVLPALFERPGDIPLLADHFLREAAETANRDVEAFDRDAMASMQAYRWPGNVRQLQNVVERAVLLSSNRILTNEDLPPEVLGMVPAMRSPVSANPNAPAPSHSPSMPNRPMAATTLREALEAPEREIILEALRRNGWNRNATAVQLDINRTTLYKKMKRLGLDDPRLQFSGQLQ